MKLFKRIRQSLFSGDAGNCQPDQAEEEQPGGVQRLLEKREAETKRIEQYNVRLKKIRVEREKERNLKET